MSSGSGSVSSHRSVNRIPLHVFNDLIAHRDDDRYSSPSELRDAICRKLLEAGRSSTGMNHTHTTNHANHASSSSYFSNKNVGEQPQPQGITTIGQLMRLAPTSLLRALDPILTNDECMALIRRINRLCTPKPETAKNLLLKSKDQYVPLDVRGIDHCLRGGFRIGSLTEIVGRAGIGKTQMAMQLCVVAARLGYGSIFIDTEKKLSLQRLYEISRERAKMTRDIDTNMNDNVDRNHDGFTFDYSYLESGTESIGHSTDDGFHFYRKPLEVMNNVTVHTPASTEELLRVVSQLDEEIIVRNHSSVSPTISGDEVHLPVKLIVLDSIAAPTRKDFGGGSAPQRVAAIFQLAQTLKRIADEMRVAVVVINQIDTMYSDTARGQALDGAFSNVKAALGTSWHHCVSTRIALEHGASSELEGMNVIESSFDRRRNSFVRTATIVKSNLVGKKRCFFDVTVKGICHVDD